MGRKILVALDNSDYVQKVLLQAVELAKLYKTSILAVSVIDDSYFGQIEDTNSLMMETRDYWTVTYQSVIDKCMKLAEETDVDYRHETLNGNPAEEIIKYAEQNGIDLIVLGHLGKSAAAGFLIGSVAQKVAAYSKCSVFIVK